METLLLCSGLCALFLSLSGLHFYWAFGGRKGWALVLPTKGLSGKFAFRPSSMMTAIVAAGLFLFAIIILGVTGIFGNAVSQQLFLWGTLVIGLVFFLRAVGDFKYVGVTKKVTYTDFAHYDSNYYTPFCLIVTILTIMVFMFQL